MFVDRDEQIVMKVIVVNDAKHVPSDGRQDDRLAPREGDCGVRVIEIIEIAVTFVVRIQVKHEAIDLEQPFPIPNFKIGSKANSKPLRWNRRRHRLYSRFTIFARR